MAVLYILLAVIAVAAILLLVAAVRAATLKPAFTRGQPIQVDREKADTYAGHLSRIIQCPTINGPAINPAETAPAFASLRKTLEEFYPLCFSKLEEVPIDRATLLRWPGKDPARPCIILMAHSDVVPAAGEWKHEPFGGEVSNGTIWGRGAVDDKNSLCAIFEAVEGLLAEGVEPACDVWISSSHNEETMGDGALHVFEYMKARGIRYTLVSDEGSSVITPPLPGLGGGLFSLMGLVEKGYANVKFTARSNGGHASTPPKNSPFARIAAFVQNVEKHSPFTNDITGTAKLMLETLAPHMEFKYKLLFGNLWLFKPLVMRMLPKLSPQAGAMLHTTCAFTMAQGSTAANILPTEASITANLRFIMHQPMEASLAAIGERAQKYGLEMEVLYKNDIFPEVDTTGDAYRYFVDCVKKSFPEAVPCPYLILFGTDSRHWAKDCNCTVRFSPVTMSQAQVGTMHGIDENSPVDSLARSVLFYQNLVRDYK